VPSSVRRRLDTEDGRGAEYRGRAPRLNLAGGRGAECSGTGARSRTCILRASMARRQRRHTTQPRPTASPMTPLRTMMMIRLVLRARRDSQSPDLLRAVRRVLRPVFYPWPQDEDDEAGAGCGTRAARRGAARCGAAMGRRRGFGRGPLSPPARCCGGAAACWPRVAAFETQRPAPLQGISGGPLTPHGPPSTWRQSSGASLPSTDSPAGETMSLARESVDSMR
jgi:hypothetical protein